MSYVGRNYKSLVLPNDVVFTRFWIILNNIKVIFRELYAKLMSSTYIFLYTLMLGQTNRESIWQKKMIQ